jgi:uncharacterized membrane protein
MAEFLWWRLVVGIILVLIAIMIVIELLRTLLGLVLSALTVEEVLALGLGELVNFSTGESNKQFFGELMLDWLACEGGLVSDEAGKGRCGCGLRTFLALMVLEHLEGGEGCTSGYDLM